MDRAQKKINKNCWEDTVPTLSRIALQKRKLDSALGSAGKIRLQTGFVDAVEGTCTRSDG